MSMYRERLAAQGRKASWEKRARDDHARREREETPERQLQRKLARVLSEPAAVVVVQQEREVIGVVGPGSIASGLEYHRFVPRLTRREIWYADKTNRVVLTVSADGEFKGDEGTVYPDDLLRRTLRLDHVSANCRLVFPKGFWVLPGDPQKARVEKLDNNRWKTVAAANQRTPEFQTQFAEFMSLWSQRGKLERVQVRA